MISLVNSFILRSVQNKCSKYKNQNMINGQHTTDTTTNSDTNTKNKKIENQHIYAILDRSASMSGKTENVLKGLRQQVDELKNDKTCSIFISVKIFDTEQSTIMDTKNVKNITENDFEVLKETYIPRYNTAIKDALGDSLVYLIDTQMSEKKYEDVVIYLFTDGKENASVNINYTGDKLKDLIQKSEKEHNIKVLYVGSNQDSIVNANNLGISYDKAMDYNETFEGVNGTYRALSDAIRRSRSNEPIGFTYIERTRSML